MRAGCLTNSTAATVHTVKTAFMGTVLCCSRIETPEARDCTCEEHTYEGEEMPQTRVAAMRALSHVTSRTSLP